MNALGHYVRIHLTGSAAGIELFGRGRRMADPTARGVLGDIRDELRQERRQLLEMAERLDARPAPVVAMGARAGERLSRLKPNGHPFRRTPLADLVDLEAMRTAVAGKVAGWEGLLAVADEHPPLDRDELSDLLRQGRRQHDQLSVLHGEASERALGAST